MKTFRSMKTNLAASVALALCVAVPCASLTGCTPQTVTQAITKVDHYLPTAISVADTLAANIAAIAPVYAAQIQIGDVAFDVAAKGLKDLCDSYLANPDASVLAKIQSGINSLLSQTSTALSNMALIANPSPALQKAILALKDLQATASIIFTAILPFETTAQLDQLRDTNTVHLAKLRPYMDERQLEAAAVDQGASPGEAHAAVDAWFINRIAEGF